MHILKIWEFLYKLIHNICPNGNNLFRWKLRKIKDCIYCKHEYHDYKHLFWICPKICKFWTLIKLKTNLDIDFKSIICGFGKPELDNAISVIIFIIYKKYLIDNDNKNDNLPGQNFQEFIIRELEDKIVLYQYSAKTRSLTYWLTNILNILKER